MADSKKPPRRTSVKPRAALRRDPRSDSIPPQLEERTSAPANMSSRTAPTKPPPGRAASAAHAPVEKPRTTASAVATLVPQLTELEAELEKEKRERAAEAAVMGEMLVRVASVEA